MHRKQRLPIAAKASGYMVGPRFMARSTILPFSDSSSPSSRHAEIAKTVRRYIQAPFDLFFDGEGGT